VIVPEKNDRQIVHDVIFDELCRGKLLGASRKHYLRIVDHLAAAGAQAVILGCTEIGMLVKQEDTPVTLYDTTAIHAAKAVSYALENL
jgi:aspartate racemase